MKKILLILLVTLGLQAQAQQSPQYFCCDSITYNIDPSQGFNISLDTTGIVHNPDSMDIWWAICTNGLCYSGQGMYDYFPQVMITDTVKVCYDVMLYEVNTMEVCTRCDTVIFDGTNWILFNMGNPTAINELVIKMSNNKMYDLLGREIFEIPLNEIYINNNKKCIRIK